MAHINRAPEDHQPGREDRVPHRWLRHYPIIPWSLSEIGLDVAHTRSQPAAIGTCQGQSANTGTRTSASGARWDEQYTFHFAVPGRRPSGGARPLSPPSGRTAASFLAPTHHVQLDTPLENFWAMVGGGSQDLGQRCNELMIERVGAAIEAARAGPRCLWICHDFQVAARALRLADSRRSSVTAGAASRSHARGLAASSGTHMILLRGENGTGLSCRGRGRHGRCALTAMDHSAGGRPDPFSNSLSDGGPICRCRTPYVTFPMSEILKATRISLPRARSATKLGSAPPRTRGPMDLAAELRGISEFLMDLATGEEEGLVHAVLGLCQGGRKHAYAYAPGSECGGHSTSHRRAE